MNRLEANRELLNILKSKIEELPQIRFIQALWGCKFIDSYETEGGNCEIVDRFNEEPTDTLNRIGASSKKEDEVASYDKTEGLFICKCSNVEHQLIFSYMDDELRMRVHLNPCSFLNRIKNAIKYIFGHRSQYGDFDEFIFKRKDVDRLIRIIGRVK